jgi:hypothetical protein
VAVRTRLKGLSEQDVRVLTEVGTHPGRPAGQDLEVRCRAGLDHDARAWAAAAGVPLQALLAGGLTVFGVDTNDNHCAAWRLDRHGDAIAITARFAAEGPRPASDARPRRRKEDSEELPRESITAACIDSRIRLIPIPCS